MRIDISWLTGADDPVSERWGIWRCGSRCYFGGSPAGNTTTTQNTSPWAGEQGPLLNIYQMAGNLASDEPQYYPGDTYAGLTGQQQGLMSNLINYTSGGGDAAIQGANNTFANLESPGYTAQTGAAFDAANPTIANLADGSLLNPAMEAYGAANPTIAGLASGSLLPELGSSFAPSNAMVGSLAGGSALNPLAEDFAPSAGSIASLGGGSMLGATDGAFGQSEGALSHYLDPSSLNPFASPSFNTVIGNTLANVMPQTEASFINGGRSDSGLATQAATSAATNAVGGLAQQQFNEQQQLQEQAAQQAAADQELGLNSTLGAAGLASQNLGTGLSSTLGAAGQAASNLGLGLNTTLGATGQALQGLGTGISGTLGATGQASSNLLGQEGQQVQGGFFAPMIDQEQLNNLSTGLNVAGMGQTNLQNQINANVARYNYGQMLPWNQLGLYESAITGTGIPGSSTQTTQPYFQNTGANIMSGLSGLGGLGMMASMIAHA